MDTAALQRFQEAFRTLNRGTVRGTKERAPHKVVLLLAVMEEIEAGSISENRIYISDELVARFRDVWSRYVHRTDVKPDFWKPFFHLRGEGFWHLELSSERSAFLTSSKSPKSFRRLKESVLYAWLDLPLYVLMQNSTARYKLRRVLLTTYFHGLSSPQLGYVAHVEAQILNDTAQVYLQSSGSLADEEKAARCGVFRRLVPKIYDYTCAISETLRHQ